MKEQKKNKEFGKKYEFWLEILYDNDKINTFVK